MPAGPNHASLSIRVPRQLREIIAEVCSDEGQSRAQFIAQTGAQAAEGVLSHGKSLRLIPDWFALNEDDRRMMTITLDPDDLELTKQAAHRMGMIPHTRFVLWAVTLVALKALGQKRIEQVSRRVVKEIRAEAQEAA